MAYLTVDEQKQAITHIGVTLLGISHDAIEAMIAKRDGDRLALNKLRVKLGARHRTACAQMNRAHDDREANTRADASRVLHDATLEQAALDRKSQRRRLTPGARVDRVLAELGAMSTVQAVTTPDPNLKDVKIPKHAEWQAPAAAPQVDVSPLVNAITILAEHLEAVLDAERGVIPPHELATLPGEVKDRWILSLVGVRSDTIAEAMPWLGRQRKIEMVRKEAGQRPVDGTAPRARVTEDVAA
jgi:hypothetical protein